MSKGKVFLRIIVFICVFVLIFYALNALMQPVWRDSWNNYDTIHGFYKEPENTIEVLFLGTSTVINGYIPMELYEHYGICAYNLATEAQSTLVSYYWLQEAYRLHSDSLKVVVANPSSPGAVHQDGYFRKAVDAMHLSSVKYNAVKDHVKDVDETISYLVPLLSYHDRWKSLEQEDFEKFGYKPNVYSRGYNLVTSRYMDSLPYDALSIPEYYVDASVEKQFIDEVEREYMKKMGDFCQEHDIQLVWVRTPGNAWSINFHNSVAAWMEENEQKFYDMNYVPILDELEYNFALDNMDMWHENYWGAQKITNWIGNYLSTTCDVTDVRGDARYAFMENELKAYHANVRDVVAIKTSSDLAEYLSIATQIPKCAVLLSVKDNAADELTQQQRNTFEELGLPLLSTLSSRDSYLAVLDEGTVITELIDEWTEGIEGGESLTVSGKFKNGHGYTVVSGGFNFGNRASILIDDAEKAVNGRGINIVVYNYEKDEVLDRTSFDTCSASTRVGDVAVELENQLAQGTPYKELTGDVQKLYLYNRRCDNAKMSAYLKQESDENRLWRFLTTYGEKEGYQIMIAVREDASGILDSSVRSSLETIGLKELAALETGDSYIAVVNGGKVVYEQRDHGTAPITRQDTHYEIASGGIEAGSTSFIRVDGTEFAEVKRGISLVVYDEQFGLVVNQAALDTSEMADALP